MTACDAETGLEIKYVAVIEYDLAYKRFDNANKNITLSKEITLKSYSENKATAEAKKIIENMIKNGEIAKKSKPRFYLKKIFFIKI